MQLRLRTQDSPLDTRTAVERKLRLNLGHHSTAIDQAQVSLTESPDADPKHRCRIRVRLRYGQKFTVEGYGEDPLIAAGATAWRLDNRMNRLRAASASFPLLHRARDRSQGSKRCRIARCGWPCGTGDLLGAATLLRHLGITIPISTLRTGAEGEVDWLTFSERVYERAG